MVGKSRMSIRLTRLLSAAGRTSAASNSPSFMSSNASEVSVRSTCSTDPVGFSSLELSSRSAATEAILCQSSRGEWWEHGIQYPRRLVIYTAESVSQQSMTRGRTILPMTGRFSRKSEPDVRAVESIPERNSYRNGGRTRQSIATGRPRIPHVITA